MTNAGHWKSRFTQEQLERKRATDRAGHKKSRQRSRLAAAELEKRLQLAVAGERGTLINRLLDDNARLQRKLDSYRGRLGSILQISQECLEDDDDTQKKQECSNLISHEAAGGCVAATMSVTVSFEFVPLAESILHEISSFSPLESREAGFAAEKPHDLAAYRVVDAVMTWKMFSSNKSVGLEFIKDRLCMTSNPPCPNLTLNKLEGAILSESVYEDILEHLLYDAPSPTERSHERTASAGSGTFTMSKTDHQRRAAAICACENSRRWRSHFRSEAEYITLFWAQYRYYLFLIWPTIDNYQRCFPWHRPESVQFTSRHPSFIDFLVWPQLRAHLAQNWHTYSAHDLIASLIQNFEIRNPPTSNGCWIKVGPDLSDLELDGSFEQVVQNISNFACNDEFGTKYPDLFTLVNSRDLNADVSPTYRHTPIPHPRASAATSVTKSDRQNMSTVAKPSLLAADLEGENTANDGRRGYNRQKSTHTNPLDTLMENPEQGTSPYSEHNLFPLHTVFGTSELATMASIANLDFASLSNNDEVSSMEAEKAVLQGYESHRDELITIEFVDNC